ncbi:MAG: hypothetical protein JHC33_06125 [Ignisphaera sp.]|jgi:hypothetical protein|nr:hypothetical protein [Ignisphaera sp.]
MFKINLGVHRGNLYTNSDYTGVIRSSLPDGTIVTIKRKHPDCNWATLNEDSDFTWYPIDLLTPVSKPDYILRKLK